jgi:hypothetical protein
VLLVLDVEFDQMEEHRVEADKGGEKAEVAPERTEFARASRSVVRYASWLGRNFIHGSTAERSHSTEVGGAPWREG